MDTLHTHTHIMTSTMVAATIATNAFSNSSLYTMSVATVTSTTSYEFMSFWARANYVLHTVHNGECQANNTKFITYYTSHTLWKFIPNEIQYEKPSAQKARIYERKDQK